jgi:hypothetical protein
VPDAAFVKHVEELVSTPLEERTAEAALRWVLEVLKKEAARYYEAVFSEPPIADEKFRQLRAEHSRLMQDYTIVLTRLNMYEGKPAPRARIPSLRRPTTGAGYGER